MNFQSILPSLPYILSGLQVTLFYTFTSLLGGFLLGAGLTFCKLSSLRGLRFFGVTYTSLFRGTPLLLQLTLIYYGSQGITGYKIPVWQAGVLAFSLNSAAYVSEIFRAGIQCIDRGQWEAARALGISPFFLWRDIILPQAIFSILPALINEVINILKESALVSTITESDLMRRGLIVAAEHYLYFEPLCIVGLLYYLLVMGLTILGRFLERKFQIT